jgi:hypothetical protein
MITPIEMPGASTHIEDTVQAIARLRADHNRGATPPQRRVDHLRRTQAVPGSLSYLPCSWPLGSRSILSSWSLASNRSTNCHSFGCRVPSLWPKDCFAIAAHKRQCGARLLNREIPGITATFYRP